MRIACPKYTNFLDVQLREVVGRRVFGEGLGGLRVCVGKLLISGGGCLGYFTSLTPDDPAFLGVILLRAGAGWERG